MDAGAGHAPARGGVCASVRACLLLLVAVCLLPPTLAALLLIAQAHRDGRAALVGRAEATARAMMAEVDDQIHSATAALQVLATSPSLAAGDLRAFRAQALQALPSQFGTNFALIGLDGRQLANTLAGDGSGPLPMHGNPAVQQRVIATGEPTVSDLFTSTLTGRPLVAVEVPVNVQGRLAYTLGMGFYPDRFARVLADLRPEPDWVIGVFDRTGATVARSHEPERFIGHQGAPALAAAMARADRGVVETDTLEGTPVIAAFQRSPLTGWTVAVGVPRQALLARLHLWTTLLVAGAGLLVAVAVAIAMLLGRRITRAIEALIPPAQALGRGDPASAGAPPQARQRHLRETDAVAVALGQAAALLDERTRQRDLAARAGEAARSEAHRLAHDATHDALTDLVNRAGFLSALGRHLAMHLRGGPPFAVCFVDLDDFKPVNDSHGHAVGDLLLRDFSARLRAGVRADDLVGRLGGDEFAVLLSGAEPAQASGVAAQLSERLTAPYSVGGRLLRVSASIGVACCPQDGDSVEALLAAADAAMYRAKAGGKGRYEMSGFGAL